MASSSKKWARTISRLASRIYFLLIILQIPLFRFPCRIGKCTTPMEVSLPQLIASEILPAAMVKALLYPGAVAKAILKNNAIPSYDNLLHLYKISSNNKKASALTDLKHLEFLAGCYLSVAGSFIGLIRPGRLSLSGMLLILWGLGKEMFLGKYATRDSSEAVRIYSTMWIAMVSAFFSIRGDVRKLIKSCRLKHSAHLFKGYSKAKIK